MARVKPNKTKIQGYLIARGHPSAAVNSKRFNSDEQVRQDLCDLHGVTRAEYRRAGK